MFYTICSMSQALNLKLLYLTCIKSLCSPGFCVWIYIAPYDFVNYTLRSCLKLKGWHHHPAWLACLLYEIITPNTLQWNWKEVFMAKPRELKQGLTPKTPLYWTYFTNPDPSSLCPLSLSVSLPSTIGTDKLHPILPFMRFDHLLLVFLQLLWLSLLPPTPIVFSHPTMSIC